MLTKDQAESVSEAILSPAIQEQEKVRSDISAKTKLAARQRLLTGKYGVVGLSLAALTAYFLTGSTMPWALLGLGLGLAIGHTVSRRSL